MKLETLSDKIFAAIKANTKDAPRYHLGASQIGHSCDRWLWLSFRWIMREDFDGRMLRLFRRGQNEEQPLIQDLRNAGLVVQDVDPATRKQFWFSFGYFGGSCDGIILSGVPDAPNKKHILEIKTHSLKSYASLQKDRVEKSKPQHFAQMQVYMGAFGVDRALYVAVCKDNDDIYTERVRFDKDIFEALKERAERIIKSDRMPEPLSTDPSWYECKSCAAYEFCHKQAIPQDVHCRTCSNITFGDGVAHCQHWDSEVPNENQAEGCEAHILHPDLVPWTMHIDDGRVYWKINDALVGNGEPARDMFTSREILADAKACAGMIGDNFAQDARMELGARIV